MLVQVVQIDGKHYRGLQRRDLTRRKLPGPTQFACALQGLGMQ